MAKVFLVTVKRNLLEPDSAYDEEPFMFPKGLRAGFLLAGQAASYAAPAESRKLQTDQTKLAWRTAIEEFQLDDEPKPDLEIKLNKVLAFLELASIQSSSFKAILDQSKKDIDAMILVLKDQEPKPRT